MKIALLTDGIYPYVIGGMQKHSYHLARHLAQRGHEVWLVHCVPHNYGELPQTADVKKALALDDHLNLRSICIRFPAPGYLPGHYLKESYRYSQQVFRLIEPELHSFHFIYGKGFAAWHLLEKKSRGLKMPPLGLKFHGYEMFQPAPSWRAALQQTMLRGPVRWNNLQADYVFSYGGKISDLIMQLGVPRERIIEIPTGIDPAWIRKEAAAPADGARRFLFAGRYERRKGIEELNRVLQKINPLQSIEFHFAGPIPHSRRLKLKWCIYHGEVKDSARMQSIMDHCHVLVAPSHSEGMPNVIMEAMARGLAVIATDVGAVQAVVSKRNGWLISTRSEKELQSALLEATIISSQQLNALQTHSLETVNHFTWPQIGRLVETSIEEVVER